MSNGVERRALIDTETVRGVLLVNGGGAVALLAFLPTVIGHPEWAILARTVVMALGLFVLGLFAAVVHNHLRRRCSLAYENKRSNFVLFRWQLSEPGVCLWSWGLLYVSFLAFLAGGALVCVGAWVAL